MVNSIHMSPTEPEPTSILSKFAEPEIDLTTDFEEGQENQMMDRLQMIALEEQLKQFKNNPRTGKNRKGKISPFTKSKKKNRKKNKK